MRIRWHGHSCFEISGEQVHVTDPHDGRSIGLGKPTGRGDIITVSHSHFDHNKTELFSCSSTKVYRAPGSFDHDGVTIVGTESYHDRFQGRKRGKNLIFQVTMGGIRTIHLGDLGHRLSPGDRAGLKGADILFVPVGGVFTIDAPTALEIIGVLKPRIAVPMHYAVEGLSLPLDPVDDFLKGASSLHSILQVGREHDYEPDDSRSPEDDMTEIWVFSVL